MQPIAPPTTSPAAPADNAPEVVTRPPAGLARGVWEAPPAFFLAVLGACAAAVFTWAARRYLLLRARRRAPSKP